MENISKWEKGKMVKGENTILLFDLMLYAMKYRVRMANFETKWTKLDHFYSNKRDVSLFIINFLRKCRRESWKMNRNV
jgi:hypothetical protein